MISLITSPLALILFGVGVQYQLPWIVPTLGLGLRKSSRSLLLLWPLWRMLESGANVVISQFLHCSGYKCVAHVHYRRLSPDCR